MLRDHVHRFIFFNVLTTVLIMHSSILADLRPGDQAILFNAVDENMDSVSMADMIRGKPLVLVVGSAS